ncbi:NAD(P)-dependent dehydrogenase (short-subunit alcohol dehydrogenase family) [Stackebrandtia endophytica]|uniref:NAD(P)-dependent dehydrogenase (Short-subunit alcohol dehydrogenase family) n=1 Tax=Stackebrandtia endophytica TaxID=1496996 RepID=A0A543ATK5_9ACTN|nr:SDR family NAD(P)-dependent oxidoreductase [Stackebrandtia endophytica]TQL75913.1 NAD(P)-dependent dehydrogenase (short-subunit alcohol dehydrogenase family) [Stackebrandtia endophytica]
MVNLHQRVILITGAGRGIGRALAHYLAKHGAHVIVNDIGTAIDGTGIDTSVAHTVATEITANGHTAIADTHDITDFAQAANLIDHAVDAFGDLDVVVNNAATERNLGLLDLTESDFRSVIDVSLTGTFAVSHHAAVHWRDRHTGPDSPRRNLIHTASGSGLLNPLPTQTNYAAAKAGVAAMTTVHALELARYNIAVNCLSPSMVRTRLTEATPGMPAPVDNGFDPNHPRVCAPIVAYLADADCTLNGQVLSVRGGTVAVNRGWSLGDHVHKDDYWTPDELADQLPHLTHDDPHDTLAATLDAALGTGFAAGGRDAFQGFINSALDNAAAAHTT